LLNFQSVEIGSGRPASFPPPLLPSPLRTNISIHHPRCVFSLSSRFPLEGSSETLGSILPPFLSKKMLDPDFFPPFFFLLVWSRKIFPCAIFPLSVARRTFAFPLLPFFVVPPFSLIVLLKIWPTPPPFPCFLFHPPSFFSPHSRRHRGADVPFFFFFLFFFPFNPLNFRVNIDGH